jgi:hypothetical protein
MAYLNSGTGNDGAVEITSNTNFTTDIIAGGRSYADGVSYRVDTIGTNSVNVTATPNGIAIGDEVMLISVRGRSGNVDNVGNYEFLTVSNIVSTSISFEEDIQENYGDGETNTNIGNHRVLIQRVPNYSSFDLNTGVDLTCSVFSPSTGLGGMIVFRCSGACDIVGNIIASELGYEGGSSNGDQSCYTGGSILAPQYDTNGDRNYGGGGDGGLYGGQWYGGGGGGYGSVGDVGRGHSGGTNQGGTTYGMQELATELYHGSGGGGGPRTDIGWSYPGKGGGIILIAAQTLNLYGNLNSNGGNSTLHQDVHCAGAGSGGSILLEAGTLNPNSSNLSAAGGTSANSRGGDGGSGRVALYYQEVNGSVNSSPTPYTEELQSPYYIAGSVSKPATIYIYNNTNGELIHSEAASGNYSISITTNSPVHVTAVPDETNRNAITYRDVTPGSA